MLGLDPAVCLAATRSDKSLFFLPTPPSCASPSHQREPASPLLEAVSREHHRHHSSSSQSSPHHSVLLLHCHPLLANATSFTPAPAAPRWMINKNHMHTIITTYNKCEVLPSSPHSVAPILRVCLEPSLLVASNPRLVFPTFLPSPESAITESATTNTILPTFPVNSSWAKSTYILLLPTLTRLVRFCTRLCPTACICASRRDQPKPANPSHPVLNQQSSSKFSPGLRAGKS